MLRQVKTWIKKHNLIPPCSTILAACSGGPDSLALVHILSLLREEFEFHLAVGHLDHMFRGEESRRDAEFVAEFCARLSLPCYQTAVDVPLFIKDSRFSAEEAARIIRYRYLREVAGKLGGAFIATGHHRDDQAETILMHLLRGSGSEGLQGMKARNGDVIRPLLAVNRREIEEYCTQHNLQPRQDSSNLTTEYLRNSIRLELMPLLQQKYNNALTDALCKTAEIISDEHAVVAAQAENAWPLVVEESRESEWSIGITALKRLHVAVQRELFRQIIEKKQGHLKGITFFHVEKLIQLSLLGETGTSIELPGGCIARKEYERVFLGTGGIKPERKIKQPGIRLTVPGITKLPDGSLIEARLHTERPPKRAVAAIFDRQALMMPITVRTRDNGDRFQPLGMTGTKKVKDFFIDAKISRQERDSALIFCDASQIIWIGGYRQAEYGKTTKHTKQFLELVIHKKEG